MSKYFYFFVYYPRTTHEDTDDLECVFPENKELKPLCIHNEESISNKTYYYKKKYLKLNAHLKKIKKQIIIFIYSKQEIINILLI